MKTKQNRSPHETIYLRCRPGTKEALAKLLEQDLRSPSDEFEWLIREKIRRRTQGKGEK